MMERTIPFLDGVLFDLDGSAVKNRRRSRPTAVLKNTIAEGKKMGGKFSPVTGRPLHLCESIVRSLGITDPFIVAGGGSSSLIQSTKLNV